MVIENYPEDLVEELEAPFFPDDPPKMGMRKVPFSKEIYIEAEDFMEDPPKKFFRLAPGREVRLRWAYFLTCQEAIKDLATGQITELRCTYDPATKGGDAPDGRKVKGTLHWVSARHAVPLEARLYDRLLTVPNPAAEKDGRDFKEYLNPQSPGEARRHGRALFGPSPARGAFPVRAPGLFLSRKQAHAGRVAGCSIAS